MQPLAKLNPMNIRAVLVLAWACALPLGTHAIELLPRGVFVEGGIAEHASYSATVGLVWPWSWRYQALGGELTATTEAYVSYWSSRGVNERSSFTQLGLVPLLRYRFGQGQSGWFVEAGIGVSVMDARYRTSDKQFSTRFNFVDVAGVGRSFGPGRRQELSLRVAHISNANIKKPNPGENFLQLRYAALF
jgi:lipid A 3-O-deacylase